jgi:DNA modification methylase
MRRLPSVVSGGVTEYYRDEDVALYVADAMTGVAALDAASVDCVVTSPPYWGLRDYRVPGQYGLEPTVDGYVQRLIAVFAQLHRVLTPRGTAWVNLGDTYGGSWGNYIAPGSTALTATARWENKQGRQRPPQSRCRAKDLQGVPWRVAFALGERGWLLRAALVWAKPNARPESVRDRLACRYEMLFLLTTSLDHWWPDGCPQPEHIEQVWSMPAPRGRSRHSAPGPPELAQRCVSLGCPPGGRVLDPFSGTGTTGVAAVACGRTFIGIDLDPAGHAEAITRLRRPGTQP